MSSRPSVLASFLHTGEPTPTPSTKCIEFQTLSPGRPYKSRSVDDGNDGTRNQRVGLHGLYSAENCASVGVAIKDIVVVLFVSTATLSRTQQKLLYSLCSELTDALSDRY